MFSGNTENGIELGGNASGVTVEPDIAGLTTKGDAVLPNGENGLRIDGTAHGNVIGGSLRSVIPQNTFSGTAGTGWPSPGRRTTTRCSAVSSAPACPAPRRSATRGGVLLTGSAYRNLIGDPRLRRANLISGNTGNGVTLRAAHPERGDQQLHRAGPVRPCRCRTPAGRS